MFSDTFKMELIPFTSSDNNLGKACNEIFRKRLQHTDVKIAVPLIRPKLKDLKDLKEPQEIICMKFQKGKVFISVKSIIFDSIRKFHIRQNLFRDLTLFMNQNNQYFPPLQLYSSTNVSFNRHNNQNPINLDEEAVPSENIEIESENLIVHLNSEAFSNEYVEKDSDILYIHEIKNHLQDSNPFILSTNEQPLNLNDEHSQIKFMTSNTDLTHHENKFEDFATIKIIHQDKIQNLVPQNKKKIEENIAAFGNLNQRPHFQEEIKNHFQNDSQLIFTTNGQSFNLIKHGYFQNHSANLTSDLTINKSNNENLNKNKTLDQYQIQNLKEHQSDIPNFKNIGAEIKIPLPSVESSKGQIVKKEVNKPNIHGKRKVDSDDFTQDYFYDIKNPKLQKYHYGDKAINVKYSNAIRNHNAKLFSDNSYKYFGAFDNDTCNSSPPGNNVHFDSDEYIDKFNEDRSGFGFCPPHDFRGQNKSPTLVVREQWLYQGNNRPDPHRDLTFRNTVATINQITPIKAFKRRSTNEKPTHLPMNLLYNRINQLHQRCDNLDKSIDNLDRQRRFGNQLYHLVSEKQMDDMSSELIKCKDMLSKLEEAKEDVIFMYGSDMLTDCGLTDWQEEEVKNMWARLEGYERVYVRQY